MSLNEEFFSQFREREREREGGKEVHWKGPVRNTMSKKIIHCSYTVASAKV